MLGTQTQHPNPYSTDVAPAKGHSWRKLMIVAALLALIGIGGWWMYQNGTAGQVQAAPGQLPASGITAAASTVAQTASAGTAASIASVSAGQGAVGTTTSTDQAADQGLKLASLAGVAEVAGTPVWNDDGTLLATLESGSILTVNARTSDGAWLAVATGAGPGWAQTSSVIAYGLQNLTTAAVPAAVAAANTQVRPAADATLSLADLVSTSSSAAGALPAPAASIQLAAKITATGSRLNVRSGPGTDYQVVAKAGDGTEYQAVGRSAAGDWLLLQLSADTGDVGWVSSGYVEVRGDIHTLPVEDA